MWWITDPHTHHPPRRPFLREETNICRRHSQCDTLLFHTHYTKVSSSCLSTTMSKPVHKLCCNQGLKDIEGKDRGVLLVGEGRRGGHELCEEERKERKTRRKRNVTLGCSIRSSEGPSEKATHTLWRHREAKEMKTQKANKTPSFIYSSCCVCMSFFSTLLTSSLLFLRAQSERVILESPRQRHHKNKSFGLLALFIKTFVQL